MLGLERITVGVVDCCTSLASCCGYQLQHKAGRCCQEVCVRRPTGSGQGKKRGQRIPPTSASCKDSSQPLIQASSLHSLWAVNVRTVEGIVLGSAIKLFEASAVMLLTKMARGMFKILPEKKLCHTRLQQRQQGRLTTTFCTDVDGPENERASPKAERMAP